MTLDPEVLLRKSQMVTSVGVKDRKHYLMGQIPVPSERSDGEGGRSGRNYGRIPSTSTNKGTNPMKIEWTRMVGNPRT